MRADPVERVTDGPLQVTVEGRLARVAERDRLLEDGRVAGLLQVGGDAEHEPERVVVEPGADRVVAGLGQRLVLVVRAAGGELGAGQVEDALPGAPGGELDRPEEVLARVAEPHAAGDPGLVGGDRAAHVERHHALVGVPDVDHPVGVVVGDGHGQHAEQVVPVLPQVRDGGAHGPRVQPAVDHRPDARLVDQAGRVELGVARVLPVAEDEDDLLLLAGFEREPDVVRAVRRPAVRDRVGQLAPLDAERLVESPVRAEEGLALGVEPGQRLGAGEVGEVVAALAVLGLVVDHAVGDLDLAGGVVPLVVRGVVLARPRARTRPRRRRTARRGRRGRWRR